MNVPKFVTGTDACASKEDLPAVLPDLFLNVKFKQSNANYKTGCNVK
jgi:hypothetical protein